MRKIRNIVAALAITILAAGIQACANSPTDAGDPIEGEDTPTCWWVGGTLVCDS